MTLQERLDAVVTDLRACDNPDRVAELCAREAVLGWPGDGCHCPIAVLVKARTGAEKAFTSSYRVEAWAPGEYAEVHLPAVAARFIARFDSHGYEHIEEPGSTCTDSLCRLCFPEVSAA